MDYARQRALGGRKGGQHACLYVMSSRKRRNSVELLSTSVCSSSILPTPLKRLLWRKIGNTRAWTSVARCVAHSTLVLRTGTGSRAEIKQMARQWGTPSPYMAEAYIKMIRYCKTPEGKKRFEDWCARSDLDGYRAFYDPSDFRSG